VGRLDVAKAITLSRARPNPFFDFAKSTKRLKISQFRCFTQNGMEDIVSQLTKDAGDAVMSILGLARHGWSFT
jgi:hypothetical protein